MARHRPCWSLHGRRCGNRICAVRRPDLLHTLTLADSVPIQGSYSPPETLRLLAEMRHDRALLRRALALLMPS